MTKQEIANGLGISRKTLYNYMQILNIKEINNNTYNKILEYSKNKNKSKNISKEELYKKVQELEIKNAELKKENENLIQGQDALLNQIEWFKNDITNEINSIKNNMQLLIAPPKKKSIIEKIFKL